MDKLLEFYDGKDQKFIYFLTRVTGSKEDAEDQFQETMIRLWLQGKINDETKDGFVRTCCFHDTLNALRKKKRLQEKFEIWQDLSYGKQGEKDICYMLEGLEEMGKKFVKMNEMDQMAFDGIMDCLEPDELAAKLGAVKENSEVRRSKLVSRLRVKIGGNYYQL